METVQDACDELWMCHDAGQVHIRLQNIHQLLLKGRVDSYDPSEAFLAIQGAALRFMPRQRNPTQGGSPIQSAGSDATPEENVSSGSPKETDAVLPTNNEIELLHWSVTEESFFAAAALACICVGPAWRSQMHERRIQMNGGGEDDSSTLNSSWKPPDVLQIGSVRSFSPVTATSTLSASGQQMSQQQQSVEDVRYPSIPEVLPAAMLRFANSALALIPDSGEIASLNKEQQDLWKQRKQWPMEVVDAEDQIPGTWRQ